MIKRERLWEGGRLLGRGERFTQSPPLPSRVLDVAMSVISETLRVNDIQSQLSQPPSILGFRFDCSTIPHNFLFVLIAQLLSIFNSWCSSWPLFTKTPSDSFTHTLSVCAFARVCVCVCVCIACFNHCVDPRQTLDQDLICSFNTLIAIYYTGLIPSKSLCLHSPPLPLYISSVSLCVSLPLTGFFLELRQWNMCSLNILPCYLYV